MLTFKVQLLSAVVTANISDYKLTQLVRFEEDKICILFSSFSYHKKNTIKSTNLVLLFESRNLI